MNSSRENRSVIGITRFASTATTRRTSSPARVHQSDTKSSIFTETTLSAVRVDDFKYRFTDQPNGWLGATEKVDWPILVNLRLDPYERTGMPNGKNGSLAYYNWFVLEFWRFFFVQQEVAKAAQTLIDFLPMQKGASFNLEAVKAQIQAAIKARTGG
jgi:arylsulfatase